MNWSDWIRKTHRWLAIAFTVAVLFNFIAVALGTHANWIGFLALVPLFALMATGLFMFFLPYAAKWRGVRSGYVRGV